MSCSGRRTAKLLSDRRHSPAVLTGGLDLSGDLQQLGFLPVRQGEPDHDFCDLEYFRAAFACLCLYRPGWLLVLSQCQVAGTTNNPRLCRLSESSFAVLLPEQDIDVGELLGAVKIMIGFSLTDGQKTELLKIAGEIEAACQDGSLSGDEFSVAFPGMACNSSILAHRSGWWS